MAQWNGFAPEALDFFRELEENNAREWFQPRKHIYDESLRGPMIQLVETINAKLADAAPDFVTEPTKAIYRIYRDTRFSKDKTPYKTHIGALWVHRALGKNGCAALYLGVSHKEVEVAGGVYMPPDEDLRVLRDYLCETHEEFRTLAAAKKLTKLLGEVQGSQLTRPPKGYPAEHPAGDLLRRKQIYWYVTLDPAVAVSKKLLTETWQRFEVLLPVVNFLNKPLLEKSKKTRQRAAFDRVDW